MYCPYCDAEVKSEIRTVQERYPVKGEDIEISAQVRFCKNCGKDIWDESLDSQNLLNAFELYRRQHHLLQPDEIRSIREKYRLSQVAFARVLGLGDKTIARYENGSIADTAQNNLIELMKRPSNFKDLLEKNKDKISDQDYATAQAAMQELQPKIIYKNKDVTYSTDPKITYLTIPKFWGDPNYA